MPRYFFHVEDDIRAQDDLGIELETLAQAKCYAVRFAGQLICDSAGTFWDSGGWQLTASDDTGLILFVLQFNGIDAPVIQAEPVSRPQAS